MEPVTVIKLIKMRTTKHHYLSPRKYVFWVRDTEFWWSAVHLTKTTKCQQPSVVFALSLDDSEKSSKLRVHTVNLAFKLRSLIG